MEVLLGDLCGLGVRHFRVRKYPALKSVAAGMLAEFGF